MSNKKTTKKENGITNGLSQDLMMVREQILADELRARHWKAQYETAYYHLEFEKILPAYKELIERQRAEKAEADKKHQEMMEELKKNIGELKIEEVGTTGPEIPAFLSPENVE